MGVCTLLRPSEQLVAVSMWHGGLHRDSHGGDHVRYAQTMLHPAYLSLVFT